VTNFSPGLHVSDNAESTLSQTRQHGLETPRTGPAAYMVKISKG